MKDSDAPLIRHIEALRGCLLRTLAAVLLLFPLGYWLSGRVIAFLVRYACPPELGPLHYFTPLEVFTTELKLGLLLAFVASYPYIALVWWRFLVPALYGNERKLLARLIVVSSLLFLGGAAFCVFAVLPQLMRFSAGFSGEELRPMLGLSGFLNLAIALMLGFAVMFQTPVAVHLAVRFGVVRIETLRKGRPYAIMILLILAAILTPPDVISLLTLFFPTWLLFELALFAAGKSTPPPDAAPQDTPDNTMSDFYEQQSRR